MPNCWPLREAPPDPALNRHCSECEFQNRCREKTLEKDDLSLLAGLSAKEREKLRNKGIFSVTQLSYAFRPRRRPKRLRHKAEKYHHALKALAIREKKIHLVGTPELKIESGTPVYLDVEGLPSQDFYYLIGARVRQAEGALMHSFWADTVAEEGEIWRKFLRLLVSIERPVLIHYGSYESTFLKRMHERHGGAPEGSAAANAIQSPVNLLSAIYARIYFPTYSNGLKEDCGLSRLPLAGPVCIRTALDHLAGKMGTVRQFLGSEKSTSLQCRGLRGFGTYDASRDPAFPVPVRGGKGR